MVSPKDIEQISLISTGNETENLLAIIIDEIRTVLNILK